MEEFPCCDGSQCAGCPGDYVCHCLRITEEMVRTAVVMGAESVTDLRRQTGAGDGCTACHKRLDELIDHCRRGSTRRELVLT